MFTKTKRTEKRTQNEIMQKALRAAAGVALLGGTIACGEDISTQELYPGASGFSSQGAIVKSATISVNTHFEAQLVDAGVTMDAGIPIPLGNDGGPLACDRNGLSSDEWVECCDAIGWDWDKGCAAWGPPAPPTFSSSKEVA